MRTPLADQLPACLVEPGASPVTEPFLRRFLAILDEVGDSVEHQVAHIENLVDPAVAPLPIVRWLASCMGEDGLDPEMAAGRQREWLRQLGDLTSWRGTKKGVTALLTLLTGSAPEVSDTGGVFARGDGRPRPGHVTVALPEGDAPDDDVLVELLRRDLPADVTFELWIGDRLAWPLTDEVSS